MKKHFYILVSIVAALFVTPRTSSAQVSKDMIIPDQSSSILDENWTGAAGGESLLDALLAFVRDFLFTISGVVAIGIMIFLWFRLLMARGQPEEFKKVMLWFVYTGIGVLCIAASYAAVSIVSGISF